MILLTILCLIVGLVIIVLTVLKVERGLLRSFLLTAGASLVGFPVFVFLHGVVYGAFIHFFGADFWGMGGDEPVFFILAVIVCPLGFLIGVIGSIVITVNKRISRNKQ